MRKNIFAKIYGVVLTLAFLAGEIVLMVSPALKGIETSIGLLIGLVFALVFAPTAHELGHILFALFSKMQLRYTKFFCLKIQKQGGRYAVSLANPFLADETQVVPKTGGNMKKRVGLYAVGGLVFSLIFACLFLLFAVFSTNGGFFSGFFFGGIPYAFYLLLLNLAPFEYASGKTDLLVFYGICKGAPTEKATLMAMDAQGRLFAGARYAELEKEAVDFPVFAEDEPLFAVCQDLKYRRALDLGDLELASNALKRLAECEEYLSANARERLLAELTYLHAIGGNFECANECAKLCSEFLTGETATAKRILATVAWRSGKIEEGKELIEQAKLALEKEEILGEKYLEEELLSRLTLDDVA